MLEGLIERCLALSVGARIEQEAATDSTDPCPKARCREERAYWDGIADAYASVVAGLLDLEGSLPLGPTL